MPRIAKVTMRSVSTFGFSRFYDDPPKEKKEGHDEYEKRTWRERCHYDPATGQLFIPAMMFKKSITAAAKLLKHKIPGKGNSTYIKHFEAGILVTEPVDLPEKKDTVPGYTTMCSANGVPGGGKRVKKTFPMVTNWKGQVTYYVLDDTITEDVFEEHVKEAGQLVGIGYFRPERGGYWGRYMVDSIEWQ